jgi:hypothetical protein
MMSQGLASIERIDILSLRMHTQVHVRPDAENRKKSYNFSHLFPGPRYPIFYLANSRATRDRNVSAIAFEIDGQRRSGR